VTDAECVSFLQWALPRLGRRWAGYRKVRRQVCRRVRRRARELGLGSLAEYRRHLARDPGEWQALDALTNITISRFYRDRGVFAFVQSDVLPALLATGSGTLRVWSSGCASGEEPYTLAIIWELAIAAGAPTTKLQILATDVEPAMLRRAREGRYPPSAVRELPPSWQAAAFDRGDDELALRPRFRRYVSIAHHDIRTEPPDGPFDLILCRYVAFTYFDDPGQRETLQSLADVTRPGAALILGMHEELPAGAGAFTPWAPNLGVYRRAAGPPRADREPPFRSRRVSGAGRTEPCR
jgi:chemotaxis protein methyltransferase CheR